ncbi:MAG: glycosyltransferase family 4 protein [Chloroflexota bacterium]|nr:glycosyltransferase family 4 protein [Chloroflexota bacterium]
MRLDRLLLTTDVVGGVWDFSLTLARELGQRGVEVILLALGQPSPAQAESASDAGARLIVEPLKLEWMQACQADVVRTRELVAGLARDVRPDVVHANQFAAACADVDVPVVLTVHSDVLSWRRWTLGASDTPPEWDAYTALVNEALGRADSVVAVSAFLADETRTLYASPRDLRVIHNGWPAPIALSAVQRERSTLVAGRAWDAAKNLSLVAEAARGWNPGNVYLAGQEANPESGRSIAVPPPLQALGFLARPQLDALLQTTLVYLSAARYDPFGLLPLQAALNGCCLLLSDIPSYRELWDGTAVFFRSDDALGLQRRWSDLLDQPGIARDLAARARERALGRFAVDRMADAYMHLYGARTAVAA